jgi:hypothetical protein
MGFEIASCTDTLNYISDQHFLIGSGIGCFQEKARLLCDNEEGKCRRWDLNPHGE